MIGFESRWEGNYGRMLYQLFEGTKTSHLVWSLDEADAFFTEKSKFQGVEELFYKSNMLDNEFRATISHEGYLVDFLELRGYPVINSSPWKVTTFDEFFASDCQIAVMCYDAVYYEVYAKDQVLLEAMARNAEKYAIEVTRLMDMSEVTRTRLSVW